MVPRNQIANVHESKTHQTEDGPAQNAADSPRTLPGTRRGIYSVRSTGARSVVGWRPLPCYTCAQCRAMRQEQCVQEGCGPFRNYDLVL